jgi:hypothetical protein
VREIDFILPCDDVLGGIYACSLFLVFILRRLGLPSMELLLDRLNGSEGCPIRTERPPSDGVMRTFGGHRHSGGPAGLRGF